MQYKDGEIREIGGVPYVRRGGVWEAQAAPSQTPLVYKGPPREASPQTPAQAQQDIYQAQRGPFDLQAAQGSAAAAPFAAPTAAETLEARRYDNRAKPTYDRFGAIDKLRQEVRQDKRILQYESALPIFASALTSPNTPEADVLLVNAIAKIGDPGTGVQQREGDAYEGAAPALEQIKAKLLKAYGSDGAGNFTPEGRQRMKEAMRNRMLALAEGYNGARSELAQYIRGSGIPEADPETILGPHFGARFQQVEADFLGRPVRNVDGSQGAAPRRPQALDPTREGDIGFEQPGDALPPRAQEFQSALQRAVASGQVRTAADFIAFGKNGFNFNLSPEEAERAAQAVKNGVMPRINTPKWQDVDISAARGKGGLGETLDAVGRGIADVPTLGMADEIAAIGDTLFEGRTYRQNLARQRGIDRYDSEKNFVARTAGQLGGGFLLPMGAIRSAPQLAAKSGAYGAGYGFGSGEGSLGDRGVNALMGGTAGAATGYALGKAAPVAGRLFGSAARRLMGPPSLRQNALLQAGAEEGVPLNMSDVFPRTRNTVATLETIPGAAGVVQGGIEGGRDAIEARVGQLGRSGTVREDMGSVVQDAGERFVSRANRQASRLYDRARDASEGVLIQPQAVMQVLTGLVRREAETPGGTRAGAIIGQYAKAFEGGGPITIDGARRMRSEILSRLRDDGGLSKQEATRVTGQIMGGINQDIESALVREGKGRAAQLYRQADRFYAQSRDEIERVTEKFIGTEGRPKSPEETLAALNSSMGPRGNAQALGGMLRRLAPDERRDFAATLVEPLGRRGSDEPFSPATFMQNIRKVSPASRRLIFGADGERSIQNLIRLSNAKKETVQGLNNSRSGMVGNYRTTLSTLVFGLPGVGTVASMATGMNGATGFLGGVALGGAGIGFSRAMAKALMNENFTRILAQAPATRSPRAIDAHIGKMRQLASRDPSVRGAVEMLEERLIAAANDNMGFLQRSAASNGGDDPRQRQDQR